MPDLTLNRGDLILDTEGDLLLLKDSLLTQLSLALRTPQGLLERPIINGGEIGFINSDLGNAIYDELSQPLTTNLIARAKTAIREVFERFDPQARLNVVNVALIETGRLLITVEATIFGVTVEEEVLV